MLLRQLLPLNWRVSIRKAVRHFYNVFDSRPFSTARDEIRNYPALLIERKSVLLKEVPSAYQELQQNKIMTLRIASTAVDGVVIPPGHFFSFWRIIGRPGADRGYVPGFELQGGRLVPSIAGGLCQLSNALCYCAIYAGLEVVERHRHGLDLFRDHNRDVPFGSGATVLYNFKDLILFNPHDYPVQIQAGVEEPHLTVSMHAPQSPPVRYRMEERNHRIFNENGLEYRENEIWQIGHQEEDILSERLVFSNKAQLMYEWEEGRE